MADNGLKHSGESLKLAKHLMKLFELNINIVCVHVAGHKNSVGDFLSRIYYIYIEDCGRKEKSELGMKTAQHVDPTFLPLAIVSPDQIMQAFCESSVQPCRGSGIVPFKCKQSTVPGIRSL